MRSVTYATGLALVLVSLTGWAPAPETTDAGRDANARQCFWISSIDNFRQGDAGMVYLKDRRDQVFEVGTGASCPDLETVNSLTIQSAFSGSNRLCAGDPALISVRGPASPGTACRVQINRMLTPEQIAALPARQRP